MASFSKDEQETTLVYMADENKWMVYSCVPKHIRKLMNLGEMEVLEYDEDRPTAIRGYLEEKQVSMKKVRELTDEQKAKMSERMKNFHANKN